MQDKQFLTKEGWEKIQKELKELKEKKLPKAVERLSLARTQGDLTENSEYAAAKEELNFIEERIRELEEILKVSQIYQKKNNSENIDIGSKVTVEIDGNEETYFVVSDLEADPRQKKISIKSPLGKALLGKREGEKILVETPSGSFYYKIIAVD